jgi:LacI family transcriptional regulator
LNSARIPCEHAFVQRRTRRPAREGGEAPEKPVSLKDLAAHLGLSTTTVSLVLNDSPAAEAIPKETKDRVIGAARRLRYRPNFMARSLRSRRSYSVGVMVPELSEGYAALVVAGIEETLMERGYMYLATSHRHVARQIELLPRLLWERNVEGLIVVDTPYQLKVPLPIVSVSGHRTDEGVTNVVLDHDRAAELGVAHLISLGHRRIAVMKGQQFSSATEARWQSIERAAQASRVPVDPALVIQLQEDSPSPEIGYRAAHALLDRGIRFSALFAFNDISAFGAIRAFQERGLPVPEAVSVVGFDDIWGSAYHIPSLTTVRQPLRRMGALAAETILDRIQRQDADGFGKTIEVSPELVVRESTGPAPAVLWTASRRNALTARGS